MRNHTLEQWHLMPSFLPIMSGLRSVNHNPPRSALLCLALDRTCYLMIIAEQLLTSPGQAACVAERPLSDTGCQPPLLGSHLKPDMWWL